MKKILFSVAVFATNFVFGQITLEHTFNSGNYNEVLVFSSNQQVNYVGVQNSIITTYNSDYSVKNSFSFQLPAGYVSFSLESYSNFPVSQHIFNTDDNLEFFLFLRNQTGDQNKLMIVNETGTVIKDFTKNYIPEYIEIFHNPTLNKNYIKMGTQDSSEFDIYSLPTSSLTSKEIQAKNKLSAFPIPTNKILNILNPQNGANKIEIFDTNGKLIINKSFGNSESKISINVENLPKGIYVYKVGELSSKFIKN